MDKTKHIQCVIRWYAISALIFAGLVIALVVMLPLQSRLFDMQKQQLVFSRDMGVLVVNSYFQRVNEIVQQISARINNQHVMTEYTEGKITKTTQSQRHAVLEKIFQNSLLLHSDLMSISQFSSDGKLSLIVGKNIILDD